MPPKRKQADDSSAQASTSTRASRSSARSAKAATTKKATKASANAGSDSDGMDSVHSAKKARTTGPKKASSRRRKNAMEDDDEPPVPPRKTVSIPDSTIKPSKTNSHHVVESSAESTPPVKVTTPAKKSSKNEPYTAQRAQSLFQAYAENDDPNAIGPAEYEKLFQDAELPFDGTLPFFLAWQLEAKEMGRITNQEWVKGTSSLKISSLAHLAAAVTELEDLLIRGKPPIKHGEKKAVDYDRSAYFTYAADPKAAFQKFYMFCFNLVKPEQSKNIEMETSAVFWSVLLVPKYPIMAEVIEFINEKKSYKATNKDLWSMMLEFCETVQPSLTDYEADGAWPTLLDDFVAWKRAKTSNGEAMDVANA